MKPFTNDVNKKDESCVLQRFRQFFETEQIPNYSFKNVKISQNLSQ